MSFLAQVQHGLGDVIHAPVALTDSVAKHASDSFRHEAYGLMDDLKGVGKQAKLFGEGVVTGAVLNPINGVRELVNHVPGVDLPKLEFSNQDEVNNSWAGKIGMIGGTAAEFVATAGTVSSALGLEASSAAALSTSGAIQGGVFTPTEGHSLTGNIVTDRLEGAAIGGASGYVMGSVSGKVEGSFADTTEASLTDKVKVKALAGAAGGTASGAVRGEGKSLMETGEMASAEDLAPQVVEGALAGATGKVQSTVNPATGDSIDAVTTKIANSSIANATGKAAGDATQAQVLKSKLAQQQANPELVNQSV